MDRRTFLAAAAAPAVLSLISESPASGQTPAASAPLAFELDEIGASELGEGLAKGKWTSRRLVDLYLERIEAIDRNGPGLNSVLETNPDARSIADQLDRERKDKGPRGLLHGIPVLVKDNCETGDKMNTTAGSLALAGWRSPNDAFLVGRLRAAGAIILGKTNLSEWANFRSTHSSSGWSGRGGQTHNPYALNRNPSGSSSGTGAAVSASLCGFGIGTETDGSVVSPASSNGIVGLKPTIGLVSRTGIIPISHSQDTAGPMARTVRDAAILLSAIAGVDPADSSTTASGRQAQTDYTKFLDPAGLKGARLGVARKFFANNAPMDHLLDGCVDALKKAGAVVVDGADLPFHGQWGETELDVLLYEFKADLNAYLKRLPASWQVHSLEDLIAFNEKNKAKEMPFFDQELFVQAQTKGPLIEKKYLDARKACLQFTRTQGIDAVLKQHNLDAIVSLTSGPAWMTDHVNGDSDTGGCSAPAAIAGYPHITVPGAYFDGLPVGLSFFGAAWSEPTLFKLAYAWEQQMKVRRKPGFRAAI